MNTVKHFIERADKQQLLILQQAIDAGIIEKLIAMKLAEITIQEERTCPVCGTYMHPSEAIRVEYGARDLRRQAFFDGVDCASFFLKNNCRIQ